MNKITIEVENLKNVSDGYHTISELYDHRCLLWIYLCLIYCIQCYIKKDNYEGWFLLGMYKKNGEQISYHCPNKYLHLVEDVINEDDGVVWDGHTPNDVIERLEDMCLTLSNDIKAEY